MATLNSHLVQRLAALPFPVTDSLGVEEVASNLTEVGRSGCACQPRAAAAAGPPPPPLPTPPPPLWLHWLPCQTASQPAILACLPA